MSTTLLHIPPAPIAIYVHAPADLVAPARAGTRLISREPPHGTDRPSEPSKPL
jgi:hypothetical protein